MVPTPNAVRAVTFDLWQTLISDTPELERERARLRIGRIHKVLGGAGVSRESLFQAHDGMHQELEPLWDRDLEITHEEQIRRFLASAGTEPVTADVFAEVARIYREAALEVPPEAMPGALEVVQELASRGIPPGIVSNTFRTPGRVLRTLLSGLGLAGHFRVMIFSDEVGIRKPAPEIFRKALGVLSVAPHEALHIGDTFEADVVGARAAGMEAVHLNPAAVPTLKDATKLVP